MTAPMVCVPVELLPCPFCGAEVELRWDDVSGYGGFVACATYDCPISPTGKHDKAAVIAAWNRRESAAAPAPQPVQGEAVAWGVRCQHGGNLWTALTNEADARRIATSCGDTAVPLYATQPHAAAEPQPQEEAVAWIDADGLELLRRGDFAQCWDTRTHKESDTPLYTQPPAPAVDGAIAYAQRLARGMWRDHYASESPDWEPYDDLMGALSQIDNMLAGLARKPAVQIAAPGDVEAHIESLRRMLADEYSFDDDSSPIFTQERAALDAAIAALRSQGRAE